MWSLFAFGGAYFWTTLPIVGGALLVARLAQPRPFGPGDRLLDGALVAALAAVVFQVLPLPPDLRAGLSPHAAELEGALEFDRTGVRPLSVDAPTTAYDFVMGTSYVLVFWSARALFAEGGVRRLLRTIAWCGLLVSILAIGQLTTSPQLLYFTWRPLDAGSRPFGPFVNRNHMVTWLLMAIAVIGGYALARARPERSGHRRRQSAGGTMVTAIGSDGFWLAAAGLLMCAAVFISLSRSGAIGLAVVLAVGWWALGRRRGRATLGRTAAVLALLVCSLAIYGDPEALVDRFGDAARPRGTGTRLEIWRDTAPLVRDFAWTGVGVGAYPLAMLVYQQTHRREAFFNQAHNQYLQIAAEGGVLLGVPALVTLVAFIALAWRRLATDRTGLYWMRMGAVAGIAAVAVQSCWETGLRMPANAVLLAVLAALAIHQRAPVDSSSEGQNGSFHLPLPTHELRHDRRPVRQFPRCL